MGVGQIPISKIWQYIDRFNLPDHWEPILLQADAAIVASMNREAGDGTNKNSADEHKNNQVGGEGRKAVRSG